MSVVLENHFDPKYDPNQNEVEEYGKWLGMELPAHKALLWIAKEGLKAPLPENWKACKSEKGELYYFNFKTGQSMWDHPMDQHYKDLFQREKAKLLAGGNGSAPTSSPPPPNGATTTAATKASSNTGTDSARTSDNDTDHDTKAASTIRVTRKSGKKRESAISFVEGSGAPSAGHLLPAAATSAAPLSHHSSVEVSDEDTSAATTPTTSEAVGTQPQQQQHQQQQPAGLGMGKLAQLKSLKGSAGPKLPPAANSAAPLAATTSTTPAATSATKTLAPLSTHKAPPPAQRDPSPTRASSPFGATLPPSAILPGAAVSAASAVNAAVSAKLDTAGQFEAATKKHQQALQGLKAEQEEEMNQAKAKHSKALAALVEEQNRDLEAARAKHTERMTTTKAHYDAALQEKVKTLEADLEREFANSEAKLRAANGARIAKAAKEIADQSAAKHQQVVEENTKVVKATVSSFASTVSDMVSKLLALEKEYTTIFQNHAVNAAVEKARVAATAAAAAETKALEERLRSETLELKGTHADQVQQLASLHAAKVAEMAQLAATTSAQVDTLKAARDKAVAAARQEQDEEVQRIATEHDAALRKLSDEYANAIVAARASHESRLHDVRRELLAEYTAAEQELRRKAAAEYDALVNELGAGQQHGGNSARTSVSRAPSTSVAAPLTDSSQSRADSEEQTLPGGSMVPSSNGNSSGNGGGGSLGNTMRGSKLPGNVAPLVPDHLNPATEQYAPGPLSVSSTNSPAARDGLGGGSNLTGDALRDAIVSVIRALVTEGSLAASTGGSQVAGSISAAPPLQPWPATQYTAATTTAAATAMTADAATFMSPQQTQRALFTKSDEVTSSHHALAAPHPPSGTDGLYHHPFHSATTGYRPTPPSVPHSVVEQKRLLEKERERLEAAKTFLERQMQGLEKQRVALKSARSKWKQDVRLAKASGTSANSRKASMLRNVHSLLDQQADGLAQDEGVLRETQLWLDAKESRLVRLEHLLSAGGDVVSTLSGSAFASHVASEADTTAMLAAYLEAGPARASPPALAAADRREVQRKPSPFGGSGHSRPPTPAPAASDELLLRIESRLAEVTSLVKGEHRRSSSSRYDSTGYPRSGPNSRSNSTHRRHHRTGSVGFTDPNTGIHAQ